MNNKDKSKKIQLTPVGKHSSDNERGIALLFVLGVLSLLLVLALAFATTAITQKKMAGNNNDTVYAKMIAESAVQRVIGVLQAYDEGAQYSHCDIVTHPLEPAKNLGNYRPYGDWLYKLGTANAFYWYDTYAASDNINWEYVKQYDSDAKTDKIRGRVAYVVIPGGGLDPVKLVKSQVDENGFTEVRKGAEVNEINVKSLDGASPSVLSTPQSVTNFSYAEASPPFATTINGLLTPVSAPVSNNGTWTDFENMFSLMGITDNVKKDTLRDWFVLTTQPEAEAFWRDDDNNKIDFNPLYPGTTDANKDELFHRFNLVRFTDVIPLNGVYDPGTDTNLWNSITLNNIIPNIMTPGTWPTNADVYVKPPTGPATYDGNCIPWLEDFGDAGTFPSAAARSKQIAANLIDYCDTNDDVTSDSADWSTTAPTFTGLEKTPYINEIMGNYESTIDVTVVSGDYHIVSTVSNFNIGVEIINLYGQAGTATAYISGEWEYERLRPNGSAAIGPSPSSVGQFNDLPVDVTFAAGDSYKFATALAGTYTSGAAVDGGTLPKINWAKAKITKAYLKFNGKNADYSTLDGAFHQLNNVVVTTGAGTFTGNAWYSWQVDDPKNNLHAADWTNFASMVAGDYATAGGTPNVINSVITCTISGDAEAGSTPTTISTNYIRNDIMQSPWELGCIHRGAKWETINLKEYNKKWGVNKTGGGNKYYSDASDATTTLDGGDANILDQIKMTPNTASDKKLNLKLHKDSVLYSLFNKVKLGQDYATFAGGLELTTAKIWSFASVDSTTLIYQLKEKNINFYSRGCLAEVTRLFDGTCGTQSNDREKEEIIGKVINLTSVSASDYFTIIVLAQTIKDIGGITINKDLDMNGTIGANASEVVLNADINGNNNATDTTGISETITNCAFGAYDQYADEILAEQKVKVEVYRDPATKKCIILKFEYIEE
ncbi:MAG: hypothetical protein WAX69_13715 [Victivallales bacterium]